MNINTTRFGYLSIRKEKIVNMPYGIPGFSDNKRFVVLPHKKDSPFFWYQSLDDPTLAFVITSPFLFKPDYEIDWEDNLQALPWKEDGGCNQLQIYVIVNIPKGLPHKMTANFIGPILINNKTSQAVQIVIPNSSYSHKFPLMAQGKS